jgi:enterobactin synthetase component D
MALGVDIEEKIDPKICSDIQSQVASPAEFEVLSGLDFCTQMTLIFSAKESLYKALYPQVRTFFGFDAARLHQAHANCLGLVLSRSWNNDWPVGMIVPVHYEILADHVYTAVCIPAHITESAKSYK